MQHFNIKIFGIVQGVGFRYHAIRQASSIGIAGFVRNEPDGSVYIEAEGNDAGLAEFVNWCKTGPPHARVEDVLLNEGSFKNFTSFEARH
jgi:acylphosphatase